MPPWSTSVDGSVVYCDPGGLYDDPNVVDVDDYHSVDGVWRRRITYGNGDCAIYDLLDEKGNVLEATMKDVEEHRGASRMKSGIRHQERDMPF